jgi:hypothetical protein
MIIYRIILLTKNLDKLQAEAKYPSCVGLSWLASGWSKGSRTECWTDMIDRPWPLYLRFMPTSWISWDANGARLKFLHKERRK